MIDRNDQVDVATARGELCDSPSAQPANMQLGQPVDMQFGQPADMQFGQPSNRPSASPSEHLTVKKKRMMIYFIEATEKLLHREGSERLTIRGIAGEAGYNSATLYNYFEDLDHLLLFGSVRYLRDYVMLVGKSVKPEMNALERYRTIYRCFNEYAFRSPEIFYNMFFGRYSRRLDAVLQVYYRELFPSELEGLTDEMRHMLVEGSMQKRDWVIMESLVREGFVAVDKAEQTLEIVISLHQSYIYEAWMKGETLDIREHTERFNKIFNYVMEMARPRT